MANVKIITDSGSDLPVSFLEGHKIPFLSLKVLLGDKEYDDIVDIDSITVFQAMREGQVPKTSQASPKKIEEIFTEVAEKKESAIYISFSSELSGTHQTAVMVREQVLEIYPELDLDIIDSRCASLGQGLVVRHAVQLAQKGADKETIIQETKFLASHMEHLFTVDNLEYLRRGGRISRSSAFLGGLLNIKPVLNVEDGKLVPLEKHRGRKKAIKRIVELIGERGKNLDQQIIGISHGDDEETALYLKEEIAKAYGTKHFLINMIGPVIGAHAGPGTLAVFFLNDTGNIKLNLS